MRHFWHRWRAVRFTGIHYYSVCRVCGERRVERAPLSVEVHGHRFPYFRMMDRLWLATGRWSEPPNELQAQRGWW